MPDPYGQLLEATIQHLETLKSRGVRFVSVTSQSLMALTERAAAAVPSARPEPGLGRSAIGDSAPPVQRGNPPAATVTRQGPAPQAGVATTASRSSFALSPEAKAVAFAELRQRVIPCVKCPHLASSRKNVVFGVGNINAELMFIGEAPGADEDEQGEPFVGKAGQLLTKIVQTMGLSRDSVYIANILKCRPDMPGQASGNRKPTAEEMQTCLPFLHEQIDLIQPKVIVALGGTAVEGLLGKTVGIMRLRGQWRAYRGTPLMPTYHPAYLLRNQSLSEKRHVWEDMLQVMDRLQLPISEKQRGYFL
jgi:uracil-DNA glycosylase